MDYVTEGKISRAECAGLIEAPMDQQGPRRGGAGFPALNARASLKLPGVLRRFPRRVPISRAECAGLIEAGHCEPRTWWRRTDFPR